MPSFGSSGPRLIGTFGHLLLNYFQDVFRFTVASKALVLRKAEAIHTIL